jgi:uncharacterized protein YkwD
MVARSTRRVARLALVAFVVAGLAGSLGVEPASAANHDERRLRGMVNEARDRRRVRTWRILGENIGVGSSMETLHDAFMDSPPHRRNELNRVYRYVGVGMARGADGRIWVTVLFLG